ncbi:MAG: hypothetical protein HKP36_03595 [Myxococcales bacterium]|nr:hypothetical protein [Myxococcales bacterium]
MRRDHDVVGAYFEGPFVVERELDFVTPFGKIARRLEVDERGVRAAVLALDGQIVRAKPALVFEIHGVFDAHGGEVLRRRSNGCVVRASEVEHEGETGRESEKDLVLHR